MVRRFFLKLPRRRNLERELDEELAFHREMAEASGNSIPLGSISRIKETSGDPWRFTLLETFWRDVAYGSRGLCRSPALMFLAVISLALGIGSNIAVFSVVNAVLLKVVPFPGPDRFVVLVNTSVARNGEPAASAAASPAKFAHWQAQSSVLQDVSAYRLATMNYAGKGVVEQVRSLRSSVDLFRCIGTPLLQGRTFTKKEGSPNGPRVVVISQNFWARRLASDPRILGQTITLSGEAT
jgi:putative ABC transport system permease protein